LGAEDVLHGDRQAGQASKRRAGRTAAIDLIGSGDCRIRIDAKKRPHAAIMALDLIKVRLREFHGRGLAGRQIGEKFSGGAVEMGH
jgi:hypothetical protein